MSYKTPLVKCLGCDHAINATTSIHDTEEKPSEGDVTICFYCGHLMAFNPDLSLRGLTQDEMHEVAGNPDILRAQKGRTQC